MIHFKFDNTETKNEFLITMFHEYFGEIGFIRFSIFKNQPKKAYNSIFKDSMSYKNFLQYTNEGNFYFLNTLYINEKYRMKGYANKLIQYFLKYLSKKSSNEELIVLQAQPMEFNISLEHLKSFYATYGFSEFDYDNIYDENGEENNIQNLMFKII